MKKKLLLLFFAFLSVATINAVERTKLNFNGGWQLKVGDFSGAEQTNYPDAAWKQVTLPRAFNEKEAFKVSIENLSDTKELAGGKASTLDFIGVTKGKPVLRIVEIDMLQSIKQKK